jgi:hypothetical protein
LPGQLTTEGRYKGKWRSLVVFFLIGLVVLNAAIIWQMRGLIAQGYGDFAAFYTAGKLVQRGHAEQMYDLDRQWTVQQEFAPQVKIRSGPIPYLRPPFEALLFWPFAYLPYPDAWVIWLLLKIGMLAIVPYILKASMTNRPLLPASAVGLLSLSFFPVAADFLQGQDAVLLLLVFALSFAALRRQEEWKAGALLALGLFKFHLVIPIILVFWLRRRMRVVAGFLTATIFLVLVSATLVGWPATCAYPRYLWNLSHATGAGLVSPQSMPNFRGLLNAVAGGPPVPNYVNILMIVIGLLGIVFSAWVWRSDDNDPELMSKGFSLTILVTILTSFYANSYDLVLLLLPIALLGGSFLQRLERGGWPARVFVISVALLLFSPLFWLAAIRYGQFGWIALPLLLALTASLLAEIQQNRGKALNSLRATG